jgi:hypothetical protein
MLNASKGSVIIQCKTNEDLEKFKIEHKAKLSKSVKLKCQINTESIKCQMYEEAKMTELLKKMCCVSAIELPMNMNKPEFQN